MNYEEFERKLLKIIYEDEIYHIRPSELAFSFDLTIEDAHHHLELATENGILDVDFSEGSAVYFVPGMGPDREPGAILHAQNRQSQSEDESEKVSRDNSDGADGTVSGYTTHTRGADGAIKNKSVIVSRTKTSISKVDAIPVGARQPITRDIVPYSESKLVETREDMMFSNASRTMFSRKIRIENIDVERDELETYVTNLFRSFGYRYVENKGSTVRFERGSVAFLIALIPLFVLIIPIFVYFFLSVLGRSTIQKEPVLLDVTFEKKALYWEIDLTFLGLHGVVLGAADQGVLNREIDTLQDELLRRF